MYGSVTTTRLDTGLHDAIPHLQPLTTRVRPRELLATTANPDWVAYVDCPARGSDPDGPMYVLSQRLGGRGLSATLIPDAPRDGSGGRWGGRIMWLHDNRPGRESRSIAVIQDGSHWEFDAHGPMQDFEEPEAYSARRVRDRFTPDMLLRYCAALGLRPWDDDFYPGPCVLLTSPIQPPRRLRRDHPRGATTQRDRPGLGLGFPSARDPYSPG